MAIETDCDKELESLRKTCLELEEKSKKDKMKCLMLENEVKILKKKNQELEAKIVAVQKDREDLVEVMIENKECDEQKTETDLYISKEKVIKGMNVDSEGTKEAFHSHVRKRLSFEEDSCIDKKISPSTPGVAQSPYINFSDDKRRRLVKTEEPDDALRDMKYAFANDPKLCMRAVCALYRQQTSDEKKFKVTIYRNGRGFNQLDAPRASKLAEFLTDGDTEGDLKKSVEELKAYDPEGVEFCVSLAEYYSRQLFSIFQNKEDPYFKPQ